MKKGLKTIFAVVGSLFLAVSAFAANIPQELGEFKKSVWNGFDKYDFIQGGRNALVVVPKSPRADSAWVVRPAFFGAFANADIELLKRGFYVAFFDVTHLYGSPRAVKLADGFYDFMTSRCGLSKKVIVEGLSRGGAMSLNWANSDPSKFAAVYVDAPVCDFAVWPCEKAPNMKAGFLKEWNIENTDNFRGSPIDNLERLAKSKTPVLLIAGDSDKVVPYARNGEVYKNRFNAAGGNIKVIIKKGCDHHPHGLDDPTPIVEFVEAAYAK